MYNHSPRYRLLIHCLIAVSLALLVACEKSPKQARRDLIDLGYSYSRNGFVESIQKEDGDALALFLLAGMDPNSVGGGYSTLEQAASSVVMLRALLEAGADANNSGGVTTPLVETADRGTVEAVALLLQNGADVNAPDAAGSTPLMAASQRGDSAIVALLLEHGADVNHRSKLGSTALGLAQAATYSAIVSQLQQAGAVHSAGPDLAALMEPEQLNAKAPDRYEVRMETSSGVFTIEVERAWAPHAADRFYNLVQRGFFDEQRFFRMVPQHIAQFGLHGRPEIAARWYEATLPDEKAQLKNLRGTLAFASGVSPDSRTTQIFVNLSDNNDFDRMGLVPFAQINSGIKVLDDVHSGYGEVPEQARILREGNAYLQRSFPELDYIIEARLIE
jgi:peptidyl-prolyl cis-trans isomerase A (cyclophilin A)